MGSVWMAEQQEPVRRLVALKVIRVGVDSAQGVARFEAERQALALMDHPNIAKVLDGGQTAGGRPYFVMDLVKGVPITDYCDQARLTTRQRLDSLSAPERGAVGGNKMVSTPNLPRVFSQPYFTFITSM